MPTLGFGFRGSLLFSILTYFFKHPIKKGIHEMKRNQAITLLLTCATLIPTMIACGGDDAQTDDTSITFDTKTETEAYTGDAPAGDDFSAIEARKNVKDDLPDANYNGYVFRIVTNDGRTGYYYLEESTGDVVDDAFFHRNATVEDRFNCNISVVRGDDDYIETVRWIGNVVKSGDDAFDLASVMGIELAKLVPNNYLLNWYDVPNVNMDKPWWSMSNKEALTLNNQCYIAIGDLDYMAVSETYCVFYNTTMGQAYDLPDIFEVVNAGDFTIDYIMGQTKDMYTDLNADGKVDNDDAFGYCSDSMSNMDTYLWAFDNPVFTRDGDGLKFVYQTEKINEIVVKLCDAFNNYNGIRQGGNGVWNYGYNQFTAGKALYANGRIGMTGWGMRDMEDDYAILPYPKWDEAQESYHTMVDGSHTAQAIPTTVTDAAKIGTITEALNAESYKQVIPVYFESALKVKGTRNEESIEILDLLVKSRYFDFGFIYDGWAGCSFLMEQLVSKNNSNFESMWKSKEKGIMAHYQKILDFYAENE